MESRQTISAVAARTGFTASALRFYEDAGLIKPERTETGYRVHDERSIERLRFIARVKQLGLSLDEITELIALWDGNDCAPVASRMQGLVEGKLADARRRISEIAAFAGDLRRFRESLGTGATDGACGDHCACLAEPVDAPAVSRIAKPDQPTDRPPIACTLTPDQMSERAADWQRVLARSSGDPIAVDGGVTVRFDRDPQFAAEVSAIAAAEQTCCSSFAFTVRIDHTGTELTVTAPPDARPLVEALFGVSA